MVLWISMFYAPSNELIMVEKNVGPGLDSYYRVRAQIGPFYRSDYISRWILDSSLLNI